MGGISFGLTENGQPGYVINGEDGADTVTPFRTGKRIQIFSGDSKATHTVDLTSYSGYQNFTLGNFCIANCKMQYNSTNLGDARNNILSNYDQETGTLTLAKSTQYSYTSAGTSSSNRYGYYIEYTVDLIQ